MAQSAPRLGVVLRMAAVGDIPIRVPEFRIPEQPVIAEQAAAAEQPHVTAKIVPRRNSDFANPRDRNPHVADQPPDHNVSVRDLITGRRPRVGCQKQERKHPFHQQAPRIRRGRQKQYEDRGGNDLRRCIV